MRFWCELVRDFDGLYYANLCIGDSEQNRRNDIDLPEYVGWATLKKAIYEKTGRKVKLKELSWDKFGRKEYAYIEGDVTEVKED